MNFPQIGPPLAQWSGWDGPRCGKEHQKYNAVPLHRKSWLTRLPGVFNPETGTYRGP